MENDQGRIRAPQSGIKVDQDGVRAESGLLMGSEAREVVFRDGSVQHKKTLRKIVGFIWYIGLRPALVNRTIGQSHG